MPLISVPKAILKYVQSHHTIDFVVSDFLESGQALQFVMNFVKDESNQVRGQEAKQVYTTLPANIKEIEKILDKVAGVKGSSKLYQRPCNQATFVCAAFAWYNQPQEQETKALPIAFTQPKGNPLALQPIATQYDEAYDPYTLFIAA